MATTPHTQVARRFANPQGWAALCAVLLVALGASVLALLAQSSANSAGRSANKAVDCINHTLGARSNLTVLSAQAQKKFADADKVYNAAVNRILLELTDPAVTPQQFQTQLAAASAAKDAASQAYSAAMQHIYEVATANPLGHC